MHKTVEQPQQHGYGQECDVLWVPEARPIGQQEDTDQPDEPAAPDRDPCRIQKYVRVGQGAWRNPLLYRFSARFQHAKALGPESPTTMRFAITGRMPPPTPHNLAASTADNLQQLLMGYEGTLYQ